MIGLLMAVGCCSTRSSRMDRAFACSTDDDCETGRRCVSTSGPLGEGLGTACVIPCSMDDDHCPPGLGCVRASEGPNIPFCADVVGLKHELDKALSEPPGTGN